jgi:Lactate racemase N-terminal domain
VNPTVEIPKFFRVRQKFPRPIVEDLSDAVRKAVDRSKLRDRVKRGQTVAITAGSRGIANIAIILKLIVAEVKRLGGVPFLVPAMGSHGGGTAEGQVGVLASLDVTPEFVGCEIRASMETQIICEAAEGFPVHFDAQSLLADHVIVVNRIKPHTRFFGSVESGLMKMMLIGLGKHQGALVYHRVIQNYTFDHIVRSVAREVIARCRIAAGIGILENGYEETADIVGIAPDNISTEEPGLLRRVQSLLPRLPFDHAELLIIDAIGKDISGSGMDTNVVGRKNNDSAAQGDETPKIHHVYVRGLTKTTHGNAAGIGVAEMCHRRVIEQMDVTKTRINCITASHIAGAAVPVDFANDRDAIQAAIGMGGWGASSQYSAMWIPNTLYLEEVECSEVFWREAHERASDLNGSLEIMEEPRSLEFDSNGDLRPCFQEKSRDHA